ncbi:MAG: YdbH domain-containing protein, partial [Pseudomonadota bacterium]
LALPGASGTAQFELALRLPQSRLEPLAGVAVLGHGTATLTFDAMTLAGESAVVALRCTLQRPWQIDYQEGRWQAGSGPQCALRGAQDELIIALRDATVERGAFALMADISGRVRDFTPQLTATFQAQREAENVVGALRLAQDARSWPIDFVAAADGERLRLSFDHVLNLPARALERSRLIEAGEVDLRAGSARYRGTLTRAGERWAGDVAVAFEALQLDVPALAEQKLALRPLTGEVALTLDERQGSFSGSLTAPIATPFTGTADWDSGRVNLAAPLSLSIDRPLLARLLRGWEHPVELTGGTLTGRLDYRGGPTDAGAERDAGGWILNGALTGGAGQLAGDPFTGLTLAWQASGSGAAYEWSTTDPGALTIARYDPGFPVTLKTLPLRLHADGEETQLELGAAQLELLGGQVDLAPARLSVDTLDGNLSLVFKNLALAEVLALHGDQIRGTGRLDGTLPLVLEAGALSIRDGRVDAQPPGGTISLDTALAQPSGQPGLDFALRALTDFRFSSLGGAVTYAPSGDLALALSLRGVNPAIERGRPIQYNLNVNNNVPMLLRSLQADRVITEQVEQRLNR